MLGEQIRFIRIAGTEYPRLSDIWRPYGNEAGLCGGCHHYCPKTRPSGTIARQRLVVDCAQRHSSRYGRCHLPLRDPQR